MNASDLPANAPIRKKLFAIEPRSRPDTRPRKPLELLQCTRDIQIARDLDKTPTPAKEEDFYRFFGIRQ